MTTQPDYLKYLESAKQAEVEVRLRQDGYIVEKNKQIDDFTFDLLATKDGQTTAYEFKTAGHSRFSRQQFSQLHQVAANRGYQLQIVVAVPPARTEVEIEHLTDQLTEHLIQQMPSELDALSTHTSVEGVTDVFIESIHVGHGSIRISGSASVDVLLEYGSTSDDGASGSDAFPFKFTATLNADGFLQQMEDLEVDVSAFYD